MVYVEGWPQAIQAALLILRATGLPFFPLGGLKA